MSLAFGSGSESDLIGALSVPRSLAPKHGGGALAFWARPVSLPRDLMVRATASPRKRKSPLADGVSRRAALSDEEKEIRHAFGRIAAVACLSDDERAALAGKAGELSRVVLALETLGAALDLFREPSAAVAWLRAENPDEPFHHRSPLQLMAVNGRLGAEITLLYLRARLRLAPCGA